MNIRAARLCEIETIMEIYDDARRFMRASGNMEQWTGGYPAFEIAEKDINDGNLYVCEENSEIHGVFCYFYGNDPTYDLIYEGKWLNDLPYGVIHRIAVSKNSHGKNVAAHCFEFAYDKCGNLKIDTHRDNIPMQKSLRKNGFSACGIIYLASGDERIAFQKA